MSSEEEKSTKDKSTIIQNVDNRSLKKVSISRTVKLDVVELLKQVLEWTPLYKPGLNKGLLQAAKIGSAGCVKVLLSAGADVDAEDENGDTSFVHALRGQHCDIMEALYEAGCTTEIAKMSIALATKDKSFVKLCRKLDIPVENEDWNTMDLDEVRILLEDLEIDPFEGQYGRHGFEDSPFMYIAQEGRPEVLEMMVSKHPCINKYDEDDKQEKINQALHKSIRHHRIENVKLLLAACGAQLESFDKEGRSAFLEAAGCDEGIAQYLLDLGANTKATDREGLSPLHWAACSGYATLCRNLLGRGIHVDTKAKLGASPLMVACSNRHSEIAELFLKSGANVNQATPEGWTALHVGVRACSPTIVRLLLSHNALPDVHSSKLTHNGDMVPGSTPLLIAIALNSMKIIRHLMNANCDINQPGLVYINPSLSSSESEEEAKLQKQRCSPVQYAITSRAWDISELLIKAGCNVASIRLWLDYRRAPVHIPEEKSKYLRHLIYLATSSPPKLRYTLRRKIRQMLGYHLLPKLEQLDIPQSTKSFLLYQDLFRAAEGSFEV